MHELSLVVGLCEQLREMAAAHGSTRVTHLHLEVGRASNVVPALLREAFEATREHEPLIVGARLELTEVGLRLHCEDCGHEHEPERMVLACPACRSTAVRVIRGEELLLRSVEMELEGDGDGREDRSGHDPEANDSPTEGGPS